VETASPEFQLGIPVNVDRQIHPLSRAAGEERKRDLAAIESRYGEPTGRTFPAAVEILVPESMTAG
jgi:hypothetical protein